MCTTSTVTQYSTAVQKLYLHKKGVKNNTSHSTVQHYGTAITNRPPAIAAHCRPGCTLHWSWMHTAFKYMQLKKSAQHIAQMIWELVYAPRQIPRCGCPCRSWPWSNLMRSTLSWAPCCPRFWKPFADRTRTSLLSRDVTPSGRAAPRSLPSEPSKAACGGRSCAVIFPVLSVPDFAFFHGPAPTPPVSDALHFPAWALTALPLPFEDRLAARQSW